MFLRKQYDIKHNKRFIIYFVPKNAKWMHVDIAGVSYDEDNTLIKGATGISILSLFDLIESY